MRREERFGIRDYLQGRAASKLVVALAKGGFRAGPSKDLLGGEVSVA
jgi:hypothetical protein